MIFRNMILGSLGGDLRAVWEPHLAEVNLALGQILHEPGDEVADIYFPSSGIVSVVTVMQDGRMVESLTVGHEGAVGLVQVLGGAVADARYVVQVPGSALRLPAARVRETAGLHPELNRMAFRYAQAELAQTMQSAACNALHTTEERLSKWLLICDARVGGPVIPLTQEFLAMMLGVQRTTVTAAAQAIQALGLIEYRRGRIELRDRPGLRRAACECYRKSCDIQTRLFEPSNGSAKTAP